MIDVETLLDGKFRGEVDAVYSRYNRNMLVQGINKALFTPGISDAQRLRMLKRAITRHGDVRDVTTALGFAERLFGDVRSRLEEAVESSPSVSGSRLIGPRVREELPEIYDTFNRKNMVKMIDDALSAGLTGDELKKRIRYIMLNTGDVRSVRDVLGLADRIYSAAEGLSPRKKTLLPGLSADFDAGILSKIAETYGLDVERPVTRIAGGESSNSLYGLQTKQGTFILRQYTKGIGSNAKLGHQVLDFLREKGFMHAAVTRSIRKDIDGVEHLDGHKGLVKINGVHYSLEEFVEGRNSTKNDVVNVAYAMAQFHKSMRDFRSDAKAANDVPEYAARWRGRAVDDYLASLSRKGGLTANERRAKTILGSLSGVTSRLAANVNGNDDLETLVCHRDIHYGNVRVNDTGASFIDFDGAHLDYRFYEFAWGIATHILGEGSEKALDEGALADYVRTYQRVNPLSKKELELVPDMLEVFANHFVRNHVIGKARSGKAAIDSSETSQKLSNYENYLRIVRANKAKIRDILLNPKQEYMDEQQMFRSVLVVPADAYGLGRVSLGSEYRRMFKAYMTGSPPTDDGYLFGAFGEMHGDGIRPRHFPSARINGDGSLVFDDQTSVNRVAMAKFLGHDRVPVRISRRDPAWMDFVRGLRDRRNLLYQKVEHPEFDHWKVARDDERLKLMEPYVGDVEGKKVLDAGCNFGYVSRWFARRGADVQGIERTRKFYKACVKLNEVEGTNVKYHQADLIQWLKDNPNETFDQVVCLSIIHNIAQAGNPEGAKWALRELSKRAPVMYFDIGQANEGSEVARIGLDLREENLESFILANTEYTKITKIGQEQGYCRRNLYRLERAGSAPKPKAAKSKKSAKQGVIDSDVLGKLARVYGVKLKPGDIKRLNSRQKTSQGVYSVETEQGTFVLRQYAANTLPSGVVLGHQVSDFLRERNFMHADVSKRIADEGVDGVRYLEGHSGMVNIDGAFYSMRYSVPGKRASIKKISEVAHAIAQFHRAMRDFPGERKDYDLAERFGGGEFLNKYQAMLEGKRVLSENERKVLGILKTLDRQAVKDLDQKVKDNDIEMIVCHRDLHSGNVNVGETGAGIFDFDLAGVDYRVYEFAWGIATHVLRYGTVELDENVLAEYVRTTQRVNPLSQKELGLVPDMLNAFTGYFLEANLKHYSSGGRTLDSEDRAAMVVDRTVNYHNTVRNKANRIREIVLNPEKVAMSDEQLFRPFITLPSAKYGLDGALTESDRKRFDRYMSGNTDDMAGLFHEIRLNGVRQLPDAKMKGNGTVELLDQRSRETVAIAQYLGIGQIPVRVRERDSSWMDFVRSMSNRDNYLYQQAEHPEFDHWTYSRDEERLELMEPHVGGLNGKRVLDVGCNLGYNSRWFARRGADVEGIEKSERYCRAGEKFNESEGTNVKYHQADLVRWLKDHPDETFDQIVCLSVIHNIVQAGTKLAREKGDQSIADKAIADAKWALADLSRRTKVMYFDIGSAKGLDLKDYPQLEAFVKDHTEFTRVTQIGREKGYCQRKLYMLEK